MPLRAEFTHLLAGIAAAAVLIVSANPAAADEPRRVEVWHGGDDIYTLGLAYALENAFRAASDFTMSAGNKPGTLVVTIPTNLTWKRCLGRTTVFYVVEFTSDEGHSLGSVSGSCSKNAFAKCAQKILAEARLAANKISGFRQPEQEAPLENRL